ncbi:MAG TPA: 16S rRNA (cytosine(1402)-N(4))-methyltransferase RsmH, partial [Chitinophagaceae bacterium]|nr:16S rRNA (cytosine(1402)-N(4))-methyltransferase RsmH [Chitinophagaceae bacterium]
FIRENFRYAHRFVRMYGWKLDGVLADLGVSSWQFDTAERGFSTRFDAALDMRMDLRIKTDASAILNQYPEAELYRLFEDYGEVTNARSLARSIVEYRKQAAISTISGFKQLIGPQVYGNPNKYLAQVFQALRIEVNDEINALRDFLSGITPYLKPGGRLCIISFHSLEDRLVKNWIKNQSFSEHEEHPFLSTRRKRLLRNVHKKPVLPGNDELNQNPRARSAKLRVAERLTDE